MVGYRSPAWSLSAMGDIEQGHEMPMRTKSGVRRALEKNLRPGLRKVYEKQLEFLEARERSRNRRGGGRRNTTTAAALMGPTPAPGYDILNVRVMRPPGTSYAMDIEYGDELEEDSTPNPVQGLPQIASLDADGLAAKSKMLRIGDIIMAINGVDVTQDNDVLAEQLTTAVGAVDLTIQRRNPRSLKSKQSAAKIASSLVASTSSPSGQRAQPKPQKARRASKASKGWSIEKEFTINNIGIRNVVDEMPISIQRGFRLKMLAILLLQLLTILIVGFVVNITSTVTEDPNGSFNVTFPGETEYYGETKLCSLGGLLVAFPPSTWNSGILGLILLMALPFLGCVREKHPWNLIFIFLWSVLFGIFMGVAQVPGGLFRDYILFIMFGNIAFGVALLMVTSSCLTYTDKKTGDLKLTSFAKAGLFAWVAMLVVTITVFWVFLSSSNGGLYSGAVGMASVVFFWFFVHSNKLVKRMMPDEYMKGVLYLVCYMPSCVACLLSICPPSIFIS